MATALEIKGLQKTIGPLTILADIDVAIEEGEFLVLVGPSGSGKSTLLSCIAGLSEITAGRITIGGRDMTRVPPADRDIAMVFQSYALFPTMNVADNITFGMEVRKVAAGERASQLDTVSRQLGIDHLLARKPGELSGGQRQRVAMARALVRQPRLFLFDEPLSNLDAKLRVSMRTEIKRLHRALDASIVYVTHDQIEAMTLASRIVVLRDGRIQQVGTPAEVYDRPANMFVADFMGSPPMNLVPAVATAEAGGLRLRIAGSDGGVFELVDPHPPADLADAHDRAVVFGIRPERLSLAVGEGGASATLVIDVVEPTGADVYAVARLGEGELVARLPAGAAVRPGAATPLAFDLSHACYFDPGTTALIARDGK